MLRPGVDPGMNANGTVVVPFEDPRSMSITDEPKQPELPKGNWTATPLALAQLYVQGHEQMRQVIVI